MTKCGVMDALSAARSMVPSRDVIVSMPDDASMRAAIDGYDGTVQPVPALNGFATRVNESEMRRLVAGLPQGSSVSSYSHSPIPSASTSLGHDANKAVLRGDYAPHLDGIERVWAQGITGKGQTVAVIDSGAYLHPDLKDRIVEWHDFQPEASKTPVDVDGHGTHVSGIIAGSGVASKGRYHGVAPDAKLVECRIKTVPQAINALDWVIANKDRLGISVVNMSLGDCVTQSYKTDAWAQETQKAIDAGLIVVVAASNECCGPSDQSRCDLSISTPGILPDAITVGAYDDRGTPAADDDRAAGFSAHGPTPIDNLMKPDIVAPGVSVVGPVAPNSEHDQAAHHVGPAYIELSGTSQATPMVAGLAALMKQVNPRLTQADIKRILVSETSHRLTAPAIQQGAGIVQADRCIEAARKSAA